MLLRHLFLNSFFLLSLLISSSPRAFSQDALNFERDEPPNLEMLISVRERFEYKVTYSFFTVGWVQVELLSDSTYNGNPAHHLRTVIEANHKVPFVSKNRAHYENLFYTDDEYPYSYQFWRDDIHDDNPKAELIIFDREDEQVYFFEDGEPTDTLALKEPASGGDVIFIISRMFAGVDKEYRIPVYLQGDMGYVTSKSSPETEMREYEAFDEPVEAYKSEGNADIDGPFGFTGKFTSWFATDDRRIPLEAHVKVLFGNVKIKLTNYEIIDDQL